MITEHTFDVERTAAKINVKESVIHGLLEHAPDDVTITAIHGYSSAMGIVELEEPIAHNTDAEPYALLNWEGHLFPFHPADVEYVQELMDDADEDFEDHL